MIGRRSLVAALVALALVAGDGSGAGAAEWWRPTPGATWQIQLDGPPDLSVAAAVHDVDLFETSVARIATLHDRGRRVICYLSAGSWERWRPDAGDFPAETIGRRLAGWPGERWLDVRAEAIHAVMRARLDRARDKGCDAVDPDNVDGYTHRTGFPLTAADQLDFNRFLAAEAHARGLAIGLKNDVGQIPALLGDFDFAVNEQCFQYRECAAVAAFVEAGKPVFQIEYGGRDEARRVCPRARELGFSTVVKKLDLGAWRIAC